MKYNMKTLQATQGIAWITFLALIFMGLDLVCAENDPGMVISVRTRKAEINWNSWSADFEPLHIKADSDDAIIIFRFKNQPDDPKKIRVTSNAAVYVETESGFVPITARARQNPKSDIKLKERDDQ